MRPGLRPTALFVILASSCSPSVELPKGGDGAGGTAGTESGAGAPGSGGQAMDGPELKLPDAGPSGPPTGPPAPTETSNCGVRTLDLKSGPGDLLLVLDRSGSMTDQLPPLPGGVRQVATKWNVLVPALDGVITRTQAKIEWGLKLFPVPDACGVPDGVTVPLAFTNHDAVMKAITTSPPVSNVGGTPTRLATSTGAAFLRASASKNRKYLVLATDGLPNCAGTGQIHDAPDQAATVQAVADALGAGIPTFVVGIATAGTPAHATLNMMAEAGGRARNDVTKYYSVSTRDELGAALETIAGQIASCTFPLSEPPPVPDNVVVKVDGQTVRRDPTQGNGWNYGPGNGGIELFGPACDDLRTAGPDKPEKKVQILYGCPGRIVE